jgi:hypothetical protein
VFIDLVGRSLSVDTSQRHAGESGEQQQERA